MKIKFKKKGKKSWWFFIAVLMLALIITVGVGTIFREQNAIYIAVAGPMSGPDRFRGEDLLNSTQMYFDEVNRAGGVNGKKLKLLIFDDEGKPELAKEKAREIVETTPAIAVLGHHFSRTSIAASEIYQEGGIAAITGTANADELTIGNNSYFRVVFSNKAVGSFIANYLMTILQQQTASIIYDDRDQYSASLRKGFAEAFKSLEGEIKYQWNVNDFGKTKEEQHEAITRDLLKKKNEVPGTILVATTAINAVDFIVALRRKGLNYPIIGGDIGEEVGELFNLYPEERSQPGYFSDGILSVVPFISDVAGERGQKFISKYREIYQTKPGWVTAGSYDAAMVLVEAMKKAKVTGKPEHLVEERRLVRDSLASFDSPENSLEGLLGNLYFDEEGNAKNTLLMGRFENQKFISAFTQLSPIPDIRAVRNLEEKLATGEILIFNDRYYQKTNVVYTGIDLNEITNLDQKTSSYTADFYLWFRYKGELDVSNIQFTNYGSGSGKKLELSELIETETTNGVTYELYRMIGDFKEQFLFDDYPFDRQKISVRFRHANRQRENLIYVVDVVGLENVSSPGILNRLKESEVFSTITNWNLESAGIFQDTIKDNSTLGKKELINTDISLEYSRFNFVVTIDRNLGSFTLKNLLPLFFFVLVSYLVLFLPFREITIQVVSGVLLAVVFFHLSLLEALPDGVGYVVALDYAFYVVYGSIVLQMVVVVVGKHPWFEENKQRLHQLIQLSRIVYPILLAIAIFGFAFYYDLIN